MSVEAIAVSVIMPVYNESAYVAQALESVLYQRTDFGVEIIVVDDCSTDDTVAIVERYQQQFPQIVLLKNEKNQGKGYSFRRAYASAKGQYFHVLDGDDYFIRYDKLQKQKDFLDSHAECVAVCHNSIRLFDNERVFFERRERKLIIYRYEDCIRKTFYCHTSTYLYRKIEPELPEIFLKRPMRGDDSCFFYHVYKSKGAVGYLPDIASVYRFHGEGIWTSMTQEKQAQLTLDMLKLWCEEIITDKQSLEYQLVRARYDFHAKTASNGKSDKPYYETYSLDDLLTYCHRITLQALQPEIWKQVFQRVHSLRKVDEICEMAGRVLLNEQGFTHAQRKYNPDRIVLLISGLLPNGGGVAREMRELVQMFSEEGREVYILSSRAIPTREEELKQYFDLPHVHIWQCEQGAGLRDKTVALMGQMEAINASRCYPFITHDDIAACAAVQKGLAGEVVWDFVYDHGISLGLMHSAIDSFIVKTQSQANELAEHMPAKQLCLIPPFLHDKHLSNPYVPPATTRFVTASAAARDYKVDSPYKYDYASIIAVVLDITQGTHIHYGPLSDAFKRRVIKALESLGIDKEQFVHIRWADGFSESLLKDGVHLFIAPFPVCSARIAVEVMSAGIPLLNHASDTATLPEAADFTDPIQPVWRDEGDLRNVLSNMTPELLQQLSVSARAFYEMNNAYSMVKQKILYQDVFHITPESTGNIRVVDMDDELYFQYDDYIFGGGGKSQRMISVRYHLRRIISFLRRPNLFRRIVMQLRLRSTLFDRCVRCLF